ncbi:MAG: molybdopterin cofactor-binding domain-containing protein, partial [Bdellovibrionales bacterium]
IKLGAATTGGLVLAFHLPSPIRNAMAAESAVPGPAIYPPNAFIQITPENKVIFTINKLEMGQGVNTSMAQLIAEELDCDWKDVSSVSAGVNPVYNHTVMPFQLTGGSGSLASSYIQYRRIGATARLMLMQAAGQKWGVSPDTCKTENGFVTHELKGKLSYGEVAEAANALPMPKMARVKDPTHFKLIGKSMPRVDSAAKSNGSAVFGIDVRIPKMNYAMLLRPPVFGATLKKFDAKAAKAIPGVIDVLKVENNIAVVAKNSWAARRGRDSIEAEWNLEGKDGISNASLLSDFKKLAQNPTGLVKDSPKAVKALKDNKSALVAEYEFPYLAHAAMEPLNCTVNYDGKTAELWSGHQIPTVDRNTAAKIFGLATDKVKVNSVYAGGSFGRRGSKNSDYVVEACNLAKILKKPVQLLWAREDDMKGGFYRPGHLHVAKISTSANGNPENWQHTIVGQSIFRGGFFEGMMAGKTADPVMIEGVADSPYKIPNFHVAVEMPTYNIPTLWWRSVGHSHTAYVMETLIDELAARAKVDALAFRKRLLKNSPKHIAVLNLLAKKSPWGKRMPKGHALGMAIHESFNSVVAHVAQVSIEGGKPRVHHVWSAVHCGRVVNPEGAKNQVEGAIAFGLSAALYGEIKFDKGRVTNGNFNDYQVVRMNEMPKVDVSFVAGEDAPTGLGEPGLPPIAPAVGNALFKLRGKRLRKLPFDLG